MAPPDLLARTLDEGAANVYVIGCPVDDCVNREGNIWLEQRLTRERVPRLRRPYASAPIIASWLPPDEFARGVETHPLPPEPTNGRERPPDYLALRKIVQPLTWRNYLVAFFLLAMVMVAQVLLTDIPFATYGGEDAFGQIVVPDLAGPIGRESYMATTLGPDLELRLEIDGDVAWEERLTTAAVLADD